MAYDTSAANLPTASTTASRMRRSLAPASVGLQRTTFRYLPSMTDSPFTTGRLMAFKVSLPLDPSPFADKSTGRGVLLDVARFAKEAGIEKYQPMGNQAISRQQLEKVAELQGVKFRPADILLIRFGTLKVCSGFTTAGRG